MINLSRRIYEVHKISYPLLAELDPHQVVYERDTPFCNLFDFYVFELFGMKETESYLNKI
jgi:hypothetical protein